MTSMSRFLPRHVGANRLTPRCGHRGSASNFPCQEANPNPSTPRSQSLAVHVRNSVSVFQHQEFVPNVSLSKSQSRPVNHREANYAVNAGQSVLTCQCQKVYSQHINVKKLISACHVSSVAGPLDSAQFPDWSE